MSIIRIKRSGSAGSPGALAQGEMGYSFLGGTQSNGGDRLYIGTGTETNGVAANIAVIGGKYYTDKLSHVPGTLTANAALIVDTNSKIDVLNVDNITINGNEISSTDTNGNITLNPNGTGAIDASSAKIINLANPTANSHAVTLSYLESSFSANLNISGDTGTDTITLLNETLNFAGGTGLTSVVSSNTVTINLDNTAVTPGSYGNATSIATFTVDQQGRLTAAGTANVATILTIAGDSGTDGVSLISDTLTISGGTGLTSIASNNTITINLDNTAVTPATYGSATSTTTFTVDAQGRITSAAANTISIPSTQVNDFTESVQDVVGGMLTGTQNGITVTYTDGLVGAGVLNFDVADPTITLSGDVTGSATMTNLGNVTITTTIAANSVALGTDTTGNYVASLVAGTGVTLSNNSGESTTPTIAIGQAVANTSDVTFNSGVITTNLTVNGNLLVNGTTTTFNSTTITVDDPIITVGGDTTPSSDDNKDRGVEFRYHNGTSAKVGFFGFDDSTGYFTFIPDATNTSEVFSGTKGILDATSITGTASGWTTARTISLAGDLSGSVNIDGSANVTLTATIAADSVALGTDTTGNYVASVGVTAGTGLSISGTGEGATVTLAGINANNTVKGVASFDVNEFTVTSGAVSISAIDGGTY
jgi:hypothetical protein